MPGAGGAIRGGLLACLLWAGVASGHGGLPLSTRVLPWQGRLYVPAQYWGVFVGSTGGPWRWICDEAINPFLLRDVYLGLDGALYATDFPGLSVSRDGGCTFTAVSGAVAALLVNGLVPIPAAPGAARPSSSVWLTGTGVEVPGAVYRSDDAGVTWTAVHPLDPATDPGQYLMRGAVLSADGQLHVLVDQGAQQDQPVIFTTSDGGKHFAATPLRPIPAGVVAGRALPLYADPRDGAVVYVHLRGDTNDVLVQVDTGAAPAPATEILRVQGYISDVKLDPARDRLLVATEVGLYYADGGIGAPLKRSPGLSQSQCLTLEGGGLYACASDYAPDQAAVARSTDGGLSFTRQFQFADTTSVLDCPAGTPVARICPGSWGNYAAQIGISVTAPARDGGGSSPVPGHASGCHMSQSRAPAGDRGWLAAAALAAGLLLGAIRPRARRALCIRRP